MNNNEAKNSEVKSTDKKHSSFKITNYGIKRTANVDERVELLDNALKTVREFMKNSKNVPTKTEAS